MGDMRLEEENKERRNRKEKERTQRTKKYIPGTAA
jgi:hypothetical protein